MLEKVAKIVRHRHKFHHYINDDLKAVSEEVHFKIIFSHPDEMKLFEAWCIKNKGKYNYDKDKSQQLGKMPKVKGFNSAEICWCDLMTFFLLNSGYEFHSTISPYKGEVYKKSRT